MQQKEENHQRRQDDAPELGTRRKSERNKERKTLWLVPSPPPFVPATRGRRRRRVTTSFRKRDVAEKQNKTSPRSLLLESLAAGAKQQNPKHRNTDMLDTIEAQSRRAPPTLVPTPTRKGGEDSFLLVSNPHSIAPLQARHIRQPPHAKEEETQQQTRNEKGFTKHRTSHRATTITTTDLTLTPCNPLQSFSLTQHNTKPQKTVKNAPKQK
jgi:hypothetical protein